MKQEEFMTLTTDGKEYKCRILFTYFSEEFSSNYVIFNVVGTDQISAMKYDDKDADSGKLDPIEKEEEWKLLEEVVDSWMKENEDKLDFLNDDCDCGCGCDSSCSGGCGCGCSSCDDDCE